jgi:hypothetical protein
LTPPAESESLEGLPRVYYLADASLPAIDFSLLHLVKFRSSTFRRQCLFFGLSKPDATMRDKPPSNFGWAWIALSLALAVHVTDEALTNFLSVYNPMVLAIRRRIPFLPLPTFTFRIWLTGLIGGIILLLAVSPLAFRNARWMVPLGYVFAIFMIVNGLQHIGFSIYMDRLMPGVYSSPLLLICSGYLLIKLRHRSKGQT